MTELPSPAPTPPAPIAPTPTSPIKEARDGYEEHLFELTLNEKGIAEVTTPKMFGRLESIEIAQFMPSQVIITSTKTEQVLYNNRIFSHEKVFLRARVQDSHGRFIDHSNAQIILNEEFLVQVRGSPQRRTNITFVLTKP